jgi:hypothetical protein
MCLWRLPRWRYARIDRCRPKWGRLGRRPGMPAIVEAGARRLMPLLMQERRGSMPSLRRCEPCARSHLQSKHKMSGLRGDHLLSARAGFLRANMPILSSVDVPFVAIMLHGHSPLVSTKTMPRFFPVQQETSPRRASKTLENVEPIFSMGAFRATDGWAHWRRLPTDARIQPRPNSLCTSSILQLGENAIRDGNCQTEAAGRGQSCGNTKVPTG